MMIRLGDAAPVVRELAQERRQGQGNLRREVVPRALLFPSPRLPVRLLSLTLTSRERRPNLQTWLYFLASSVITSRQGGASCFQITLHKNLNKYHRVEDIPAHSSLHPQLAKEPK